MPTTFTDPADKPSMKASIKVESCPGAMGVFWAESRVVQKKVLMKSTFNGAILNNRFGMDGKSKAMNGCMAGFCELFAKRKNGSGCFEPAGEPNIPVFERFR
jgi:hypothetical protein